MCLQKTRSFSMMLPVGFSGDFERLIISTICNQAANGSIIYIQNPSENSEWLHPHFLSALERPGRRINRHWRFRFVVCRSLCITTSYLKCPICIYGIPIATEILGRP